MATVIEEYLKLHKHVSERASIAKRKAGPAMTAKALVRRVTADDFTPLHEITGDPREQGRVCTLVSQEHGGSTDIMVGLARFDAGESRRPHHHPNASEAYVVLSGELVIHIDGEDITAGYGTAVYIPPNVVHSIRNDSDAPAEVLWTFNLPERSDHGLVYDEDVWPGVAGETR